MQEENARYATHPLTEYEKHHIFQDNIGSYLDINSLAALAGVCHNLNRLNTNDVIWGEWAAHHWCQLGHYLLQQRLDKPDIRLPLNRFFKARTDTQLAHIAVSPEEQAQFDSLMDRLGTLAQAIQQQQTYDIASKRFIFYAAEPHAAKQAAEYMFQAKRLQSILLKKTLRHRIGAADQGYAFHFWLAVVFHYGKDSGLSFKELAEIDIEYLANGAARSGIQYLLERRQQDDARHAERADHLFSAVTTDELYWAHSAGLFAHLGSLLLTSPLLRLADRLKLEEIKNLAATLSLAEFKALWHPDSYFEQYANSHVKANLLQHQPIPGWKKKEYSKVILSQLQKAEFVKELTAEEIIRLAERLSYIDLKALITENAARQLFYSQALASSKLRDYLRDKILQELDDLKAGNPLAYTLMNAKKPNLSGRLIGTGIGLGLGLALGILSAPFTIAGTVPLVLLCYFVLLQDRWYFHEHNDVISTIGFIAFPLLLPILTVPIPLASSIATTLGLMASGARLGWSGGALCALHNTFALPMNITIQYEQAFTQQPIITWLLGLLGYPLFFSSFLRDDFQKEKQHFNEITDLLDNIKQIEAKAISPVRIISREQETNAIAKERSFLANHKHWFGLFRVKNPQDSTTLPTTGTPNIATVRQGIN